MKTLLPKVNNKTILVDFDGTILNSFDRHQILLETIIKNKKVNINIKDYLESKRLGISTKEYLLKKGVNPILIDEINKDWIKNIENPEMLKYDFLYKDTLSFLIKTSKKNDLILVTARSNKKNTLDQIKKIKIEKFFKKIYVIKPNKNIPDKIKIAKKHNCFAIIGDTEIEKKVSDELKINFFCLNRGARSKKFWDNSKISSYSSLREIKI